MSYIYRLPFPEKTSHVDTEWFIIKCSINLHIRPTANIISITFANVVSKRYFLFVHVSALNVTAAVFMNKINKVRNGLYWNRYYTFSFVILVNVKVISSPSFYIAKLLLMMFIEDPI